MNATDADRKAAAAIAVLPEMRELILAGKADHHAMPFALHRLESVQAMVDAHEALIDHANALAEELNRWVEWLARTWSDDDDDLTYLNGDGWRDAEALSETSVVKLGSFATWMLDGGNGE